MKNKKNKLVIFGTGNPYLNTQIIQINPGPELVIKQKGDKMRKMIASVLVALALSASMISPSQAYWKQIGNNIYWCEFGKFCK